eukprot:CAMPEP_0113919250 /NCGR_PEP_ID=MMETSP0780_2-20120614/33808_1 /TAXON_ID=652834 /ORGANISM="Palpitomonas bilix" /LENGTH=306 /DNA_ID=CAMNT_0000919159 /DNA_START=224 /DNA_END=1140 /DNA_ORIENTATION=+ /assembly_acc=CAM_ASM_000599
MGRGISWGSAQRTFIPSNSTVPDSQVHRITGRLTDVPRDLALAGVCVRSCLAHTGVCNDDRKKCSIVFHPSLNAACIRRPEGHKTSCKRSSTEERACALACHKYLKSLDKGSFLWAGRWACIQPLFGMDDPASVLFCLLNILNYSVLLPHFLRALKRHHGEGTLRQLSSLWCLNYIGGAAAFVTALIFHWKDTEWTQYGDYIGAIAFSYLTLSLTVRRVFDVSTSAALAKLAAGALFFFSLHISYLLFVDFDFKLNIALISLLGIINTALLCSWCFYPRISAHLSRPTPPHRTSFFVALSLIFLWL